ncbi:MAG: two-component system response regulator, partial [Kofleriaceae bacterium]
MNRRILLIDADPGFHQTLTRQLARYAFDVVVQPEPDQAIALASADLPALLIVGVEEPDKTGFKVFQRCKKAPLSKVPIMLITASVPPESFAKHKSLKTHADEYLDKRSFDGPDLLAKIDALITLGDPIGPAIEDDLDIPVEVDEIALADGDMVLEEEVGDDAGDFDAAPKRAIESTHSKPAGAAHGRIDSVVDADIEDAFGGLLGDDALPDAAAPIATMPEPPPLDDVPEEREEISVVSGIPEVVGGRPGDSIPPPLSSVAESPSVMSAPLEIDEAAPEIIHDGGLSAPQDFDSFSREYGGGEASLSSGGAAPENLPSGELAVIVEEAAPEPEPALQPINTLPPESSPALVIDTPRFESQPAIALDADDLLSEDDGPPIEIEPPDAPEPATASEPPPVQVPSPPVLPSRPKTPTEQPP